MLLWLETAIQDLRYALRTLRRNPGFAATAVLSLALGIGANTALFSLLDTLLLKMLPVAEPQRLVRVRVQRASGAMNSISYPLFDRLRTRSRFFSGATAVAFGSSIEEKGQSVPARVQKVSGEFFDVLGVAPAAGRVFHESDSVAVISDSFWRKHYGASSSAIGAHFRESTSDFNVIGIAPPNFHGVILDGPSDVWVPVERTLAWDDNRWAPNAGWLDVIARLKPGATEEQARADVQALLNAHLADRVGRMRFDLPQQRAEFLDRRAVLEPAGNGISLLREQYALPLKALQAVVGMVLLIACANLANLLLARATAREREIVVRLAIGASRPRLIRQLLTENILVGAAGAAVALMVAYWLSAALLRFLPAGFSSYRETLSFHPDARVLAFTGALAMLTCLLFGLAPALRATRPSVRVESGWAARALIVLEVAVCVVLLAGAGLFVHTLHNLRTFDAGFVRDHAGAVYITYPRAYTADQVRERKRALRDQVADLPGVIAAGFSNIGLLINERITWDVEIEGYTHGPNESPAAAELRVSPGFFAAMGTPILLGRDFTDRDDASAPKVALVNESFVRQYFGNDNPIGKRFGIRGPNASGFVEIAGVVKDAKRERLRDAVPPTFYRPFTQAGTETWMTLAVRASGNLGPLAQAIRQIGATIDPGISVSGFTPFNEIVDQSLLSERMVAEISSAFGALALVVAAVGLYGVLAYRVARRTREIGVRMALGASRGGVQWMVLRESLVLLGLGAALGVPLALGGTRFVEAMLYGVTPGDPSTMAIALGVLLLVSLAAAYIPARRAARVDPMVALRCE